jgi:hypothetical protein
MMFSRMPASMRSLFSSLWKSNFGCL